MIQAPEPAISWDYSRDGWPRGKYGPLPKEMEEVAIEQMDNFAAIMEARGIRVDRATPIDFSQTTQTPDWVQKTMVSCMPPRDYLLTIGNEILEATISYRSRWFEFLCYRPVLEQYFKEDPNFRWEAAPKPRLADDSYVMADFWEKFDNMSHEEQLEHLYKKQWNLTEKEPIWEAADVARFGKDLFVQVSTATNRAAVDWLRRHFPDHRVHEVSFLEANPVHIDATLVPIRPGLAMLNRTRPPLQDELVELFKINGWELVECAPPAHDTNGPLSMCTQWLSLNILMLDPNTVCVEEKETAQMEQFSKMGLEVIPVPFWEVAAFGGGLHCSTADIYRGGQLEDYFPRQIKGF